MSLFDRPVSSRLLWPPEARWPRRRAWALIKRFQACFPELTYDMDLSVNLANAQAFLDAGKRRVRLYGGLVRHRKIGAAGLALTLSHETGHHLGGAPHLKYYHWLSSEERATEWAVTVGLPSVFGNYRAARIGHEGFTQLRSLGLAN